ncbi:MAG TPA: DedA family protein [Ktedonobacterales bacterium]|nr:DedA family protein [Ktedonobacterales bacterium]
MEHLLLADITQSITDLIRNWYVTFGYLGIVLAMAIESCCIPLPSEIVMPLAGVYIVAAAGPSSFWPALIGVALAGALGCLIGSSVAFAIGYAGGRPLLLKYGRYVLISQADSDRADRWFARFGPPVAFFSRLLPVVRTYISLPAGIYRMNFVKFAIYTVLGSLPWCLLLAFAGYKLGNQFEKLGTYFHGADVVILVILVILVALYVYRHIKHDRAARAALAERTAQAQRRPNDWPANRPAQMPPQMPRRDAGNEWQGRDGWNQDNRRGGPGYSGGPNYPGPQQRGGQGYPGPQQQMPDNQGQSYRR